jgi:arabinofuranosyltransferase
MMTIPVELEPGRTTPGRPARRAPLAVSAVVLLAVFLAGAWAAWSLTIDDAFISFRYAANLVAGHGPVWNVDGPRVEGFTNFAWVIWSAGGAALGLALPLFAKVTSLVLGLATLYVLVREGHRRAGLTGVLAGAGAYVVFLPTYFHISAGLETAAFALVLLRVVVLGLRVLADEPVRAWEPPLLLLLLGMLRPEGVLAALPVVALWFRRERARAAPRWWTAAAVVVGAGYFGWRWRFYGQLLPNTFYVKFGHLGSGWVWTQHTTVLLLPLLLLTLSLVFRRATRAAGVLLVATVAATYVTYAVSGPTMDYLDRFADHAFPVLCLGTGLAAGTLTRRFAGAALGLVAVGWTAVAGVSSPELGLISNYGPDLQRAHVAIGKALAGSDVPAAARTVAVTDAGAIPYYSGWTSIDYIGLNDPEISHGADPTEVVLRARPTVLVVTSVGPHPVGKRYGFDAARATIGYELVDSVEMRAGYWQDVFVLPPHAATVGAHVRELTGAARQLHDPGRPESTVGRWLDRLRSQLPF